MMLKELLNGGVVQSRHPLLLSPGEVQRADNCILRPGDPSLHTAPGRTSYGTVLAANPVRGLRGLRFDEEQDVLVALCNGVIYSSQLSATTGTFASLITGLTTDADATLDSIQYNDKHILLTGFDLPRIIYYTDGGSQAQVVTARTLGMKAVSDFVGVSVVPGAWSALTSMQNGYYWFFITEVYHPDQPDQVESTFDGIPKYCRITDYLTQGVSITRNARVNDGTGGLNTATHWRVYMAPRQAQDPYPAPDLSEYRRIATIQCGVNGDDTTRTQLLTDSNPWQEGWASVRADVAGCDTLLTVNPTYALSSVTKQNVASCTTVLNSTNVTTATPNGFNTVSIGMRINGTGIPYGSVVVRKDSTTSIYISNPASAAGTVTLYFGNSQSWDSTYGFAPPNNVLYRAVDFQNFGIQNVGGFSTMVVTGIKVEVAGYTSSSLDDRGFYVSLIKGNPASPTASSGERWIKFPRVRPETQKNASGGIMSSGGIFDTWGVSWSPSDFIDGAATFTVRLRKHASAADQDHYIDGVRVTIYGGGTAINMDGEPFRTIILTDQLGISTGIGAAGAPPVASTGDVFDGMVVMNDKSDLSCLVGSLPDEPEAYPSAYRLPLEGGENDEVTVFKRLGNIGVIGCVNSVKRLNYFPRETDADFSRGRCYENIATDHGMVGPRSAVRLTLPGRGEVMAYLAHSGRGLNFTDGVTTHPLNSDLDWETLIEPTLIQRARLEVYPKSYLLALYYTPYGGTRNTKVMYFPYHPSHVKSGFQLPAIGPVDCSGESAASILMSGVPRLFTGHGTDGKVYLEDSGTVDENGDTPSPIITTRRFQAADIGSTGRVERAFMVTDASGDATTGGFSLELYRQNQLEGLTLIHTVTGDTATGGLIPLWPNDDMGTFEAKITKSADQTASLRLHFFCFDAKNYGPQAT